MISTFYTKNVLKNILKKYYMKSIPFIVLVLSKVYSCARVQRGM